MSRSSSTESKSRYVCRQTYLARLIQHTGWDRETVKRVFHGRRLSGGLALKMWEAEYPARGYPTLPLFCQYNSDSSFPWAEYQYTYYAMDTPIALYLLPSARLLCLVQRHTLREPYHPLQTRPLHLVLSHPCTMEDYMHGRLVGSYSYPPGCATLSPYGGKGWELALLDKLGLGELGIVWRGDTKLACTQRAVDDHAMPGENTVPFARTRRQPPRELLRTPEPEPIPLPEVEEELSDSGVTEDMAEDMMDAENWSDEDWLDGEEHSQQMGEGSLQEEEESVSFGENSECSVMTGVLLPSTVSCYQSGGVNLVFNMTEEVRDSMQALCQSASENSDFLLENVVHIERIFGIPITGSLNRIRVFHSDTNPAVEVYMSYGEILELCRGALQ